MCLYVGVARKHVLLVGGDWFEDETTLTEGEVEDREKSGDETSSASAKARVHTCTCRHCSYGRTPVVDPSGPCGCSDSSCDLHPRNILSRANHER